VNLLAREQFGNDVAHLLADLEKADRAGFGGGLLTGHGFGSLACRGTAGARTTNCDKR